MASNHKILSVSTIYIINSHISSHINNCIWLLIIKSKLECDKAENSKTWYETKILKSQYQWHFFLPNGCFRRCHWKSIKPKINNVRSSIVLMSCTTRLRNDYINAHNIFIRFLHHKIKWRLEIKWKLTKSVTSTANHHK